MPKNTGIVYHTLTSREIVVSAPTREPRWLNWQTGSRLKVGGDSLVEVGKNYIDFVYYTPRLYSATHRCGRGGWNPSRERSRAVDCLWEFCMEMFSPSTR